MDRRQVLQVGLSALAGAMAAGEDGVEAQVAGQPPPPPATNAKPLGVHPLGAPFEGWQGTMLEVTYPPGAESAAHMHPGPTFGYVVSGKVRWAINGEAPRVLEPGQSFFEPMGSVHSTSANASATEPARLSVVILAKPGEPLSRPAVKPSGDQ